MNEEKQELLFSIIIPIYNCEKYIERCIKSIIEQDFFSYEIIAVDDGSKDNSLNICNNIAENFKQVKVFSKKNSGVSDTRNYALNRATGKYILFMDSDDYVEKDYLQTAIDIIKKYNVEFVNFGFFSDVENERQELISSNRICMEDILVKKQEELNEKIVELWDKHMLYNLWNKVYLREKIVNENIEFPTKNFGEDMEFNIRYMKKIDTFYNSSKCFYHYIKERKNSITNKYNDDLFSIRIAEYHFFNKYFEERNIEYNRYIEFSSRRFIERVVGCIENICSSNLSIKNKLKKIKEILKNETTRDTVKIARPHSKKMKLILIPIKLRMTLSTFLIGTLISIVRKSNPAVFNQLKNKR